MRSLVAVVLASVAGVALPASVSLGAEPESAADRDSEAGFRPIFDGNTLAGWRGEEGFWRAENGAIVGESTADNPLKHNTFLVWDQGELDDFELRLEFRLTSDTPASANSGIQFRSQDRPDGHVFGYQADLDLGGKWLGACYDELGRGLLAGRGERVRIDAAGARQREPLAQPTIPLDGVRGGDWTAYSIRAAGDRLTIAINGQTTAEVIDQQASERELSGLLALQLHAGPPQRVAFRNLRLKRLPLTDGRRKVVFVAGKPSHARGAHEHFAGCTLLSGCLNKADDEQGLPVHASVYRNGWPDDPTAFDNADSLVFYCDGGAGHFMNDRLDEIGQLMDRGVGLVCVHYGVEVPRGPLGEALRKWIGGCFESDWSVNPHWTAHYDPLPEHPTTRGVRPFEVNDEWYYHMRFRDGMQGVTPILTDLPPPESLSRDDGPHSNNPAVREAVLVKKEPQHTAWACERADGKGRGFGFTGGHFHRNWQQDDFRKLVLNAIVWTAGAEVPAEGVPSATPTDEEMDANLDTKGAAAAASRTTRVARQEPRARRGGKPATDEHAAASAVSLLDAADDLEVSLYAAEPMLRNPTNIDIDAAGRVWVCEVVNYRRFANRDQPERIEGDRILVLEDTDHDGRADKSTVFHQGTDVNSAHGICVLGTPDGKGTRALVSCGDSVFFLIDDDGNLKSDRKELLFTGIAGTEHDHGIHAFVFGPDGKLYFNFGNAGKHLCDKDGRPIVDKAGRRVDSSRQPYQEGMVFRCNLDGSSFETLAWNFRNNWEVCVDSFGGIWQSDNDDDGHRGTRINYVMEFGNYGYRDEMTGAGWQTPRTGWEDDIPRRHWHLNDPGVVPNLLDTGAGSPTGICVYEGSLLPAAYRGALLHTDAGPNVVRAYLVKPEGAGYAAEIKTVIDGSRDKWFRPSDICVAPDGSVIVADWYDPGVGGHRMGDVDRGRLFRITSKRAESAPPIAAPALDLASTAGQIQALQSPNLATRYLAWTALHQRGSAPEGALRELLKSENPRFRGRALWLLGKAGLSVESLNDVLRQGLRDPDSNVRCATIRMARQISDDVDTNLLLAGAGAGAGAGIDFHDSPADVRREAAIGLRDLGLRDMVPVWVQLARHYDGTDRWFLEALGIAADGQWRPCLREWLKVPGLDLSSKASRDIIWRSRGPQTPDLLRQLIADPRTPRSELPRLLRAFDFQDVSARDPLRQLAFAPLELDAERVAFIQAEAVNRLGVADFSERPEAQAVLGNVLQANAGSLQFVQLVSRFHVADRYDDLLALAIAHPREQLAIAAIEALFDRDQLASLREALRAPDRARRDAFFEALATAADGRAVPMLLELLDDPSREIADRRAAIRTLGAIRPGALALQERAEQGKYDAVLREALAAALHTAPWSDVKESAARLFPAAAAKNDEPLPAMADLLSRTGDVAHGRLTFHSTGTCSKCHAINGIGQNIGPDLSEIGRKLGKPALYESILYPSAAISHNYETWTILETSGDVKSGLLVSETADEIQLKDEKGLVRTIPLSAIEERRKQDVSMMPADLHHVITVDELVDVVEYLATLTQAAPVSTDAAATGSP